MVAILHGHLCIFYGLFQAEKSVVIELEGALGQPRQVANMPVRKRDRDTIEREIRPTVDGVAGKAVGFTLLPIRDEG